jgi:arsenical pump membrane protein
VWGAALGTGLIAAVLSSVMNNMPTVLVGALSIDAAHATGAVRKR